MLAVGASPTDGRHGPDGTNGRGPAPFEVGLQNSGLVVALATVHFGACAALMPALFGVWQNVSWPALATLSTHLDGDRPAVDNEPAIVSD